MCNQFYRTCDRLKLFEAVVTPVVLYSSVAWALTQAMEKQLHVAWRKMLRYVFCLHRRKIGLELEDWVSYIQRTAGAVDELAARYCLKSWVVSHRTKKCKFAGKVARHSDGRWSSLAMSWRPEGARSRGRPCTRWCDDLDTFAGGSWPEQAQDVRSWELVSELFALRPK